MTRDETTIDRWTKDAQFFEYSKAANPIGSGLTSKVPLADFPHHLHEEGPTRIIPFDLSEQLRCPGPATSPALCANFIRILGVSAPWGHPARNSMHPLSSSQSDSAPGAYRGTLTSAAPEAGRRLRAP